jgi:hypothetical protein
VAILGLWLAPAALAHHPIVSGTTACQADGTQKVTWTVTNSESTAGSNRTMTIDAGGVNVSQGSAINGISAGQSYPPTPTAGSTKTGTQSFGGKAGGSVTLSITASWSNNGPQHVTSALASVTLKSDCPSPPEPKVEISQNCADGAKMVFKNDGDTATSFTVSKNGNQIDTVNVAGHGTATKTYAMSEDETATFRVTSGTFDSGNKSLTNNCTNPGATIVQDCDAGGAKLTLTNLGAQKATSFDVFKNGNKIDTVAISAGATVTKSYAMNEDETATFRATTSDGYDSGNVTLTNDCTNPKAVIVQDCDAGGAKLTLTNLSATKATSFDVLKNGNKIDTVAVGAGATVVKTYAMNEDETATFRATAGNYDSGNVSLTNNCTNPDSVIAQSCDAGGAKLTLTNLGAQKPTSFDVFKNGTKIDTVAVGAGATVNKTYAMGEDETATFRATAGSYDSGNVSLTNNCTNPGADVVQSCDAGGAKVTLTNANATKPVTFKIFKDGVQVGADVTVAANGTATRNVAIAEDGTATIKVTAGAFSVEKSIKNDCTNPKALVADSCVDGGAKVTLTNPNATKAVTFQVFKNGVQVDGDAVVAPNATVTRIVPIAEDATATIKVTGTDFTQLEKSVTHDCTNPAALVAQDCAEGGAVFSLSNDGSLPTTFQIFKNGEQVGDDIAVGAVETVTKTVAMTEDEKSTFQVKTTDGFASEPVELVNNCTSPAAAIAQTCADGGAVVSLSNEAGELPTSFDVFKNGAKIDTVAVGAGATVDKSYAMGEDETSVFRATTADGFDSGAISLTHNCTTPGAAIIQSCDAGGAVFTLTNGGLSADSFDVMKNGTKVETVAVAGNSSVTKAYAMTEDEQAIYRAVTGDGFDSGDVVLKHDCAPPTEVLGVQFQAPLARTGLDSIPMALRAMALLGLGYVLVRLRRVLLGAS